MIEVKRVEIRDRATLIPAIALGVSGEGDPLLARAGFQTFLESHPHVILIHLTDSECHWDAYDWPNRTMHEAHKWLQEYWFKFKDGDVLDVQFILGETKKAKESEL